MNYDLLKPDIISLHITLIDWLKEISQLMNRISENFSSDDESGKKANELKILFEQRLKELEKMELVMVITAPMSAGKSTIINALCGLNIMPKRPTAMTTLPTKIVFGEKPEPTLTLTETSFKVFQKIWNQLYDKFTNVSEIDNDQQTEIKKFEYLENLKELIITSRDIPIAQQTIGCDNISDVLTKLNDLIRLYTIINPKDNPIKLIDEVPVIETSLWKMPTANQSEQDITFPIQAKFVIIDTPGINEAGQAYLVDVVNEQIDKSHMILLVIDPQYIGSDAAKKIKENALKPMELTNNKNLYILVNKIDQRKQDSLDSKQLQKFVSNDLNLFNSDSDIKERLFECSALRAFYSARFMQEIKSQEPIEDSIFYDEFYKEISQAINDDSNSPNKTERAEKTVDIAKLTEDYQNNNIDEEKLEKLEKSIKLLYKYSGFDLFIKKAINILINNATPKLMETAIMTVVNTLTDFLDKLIIRNITICKDVRIVNEKIRIIKDKIDDINALEKKIGLDFLKGKKEIESQFNSYFIETEDNLKKEITEHINFELQSQTSKIFKENLGNLLVSKRIADGDEIETLKFETSLELNIFLENLSKRINDIVNTSFSSLNKEIRQAVRKKKIEHIKSAKIDTERILEEAKAEIQKDFPVSFKLPSLPTIEELEDSGKFTENQENFTKYLEPKIELKDKRFWWFFLWLIPKKVEVVVENGGHILKKQELSDCILQSLQEKVQNNKRNYKNYIYKDLKLSVKSYFDYIREYLNGYKNIFNQSLKDHALEINHKEELISKLSYLQTEIEKHIEYSETYKTYI